MKRGKYDGVVDEVVGQEIFRGWPRATEASAGLSLLQYPPPLPALHPLP